MKLSNLPIGTRLGAGFAIVLLMLIGVAYLGIHGMQQSNQSLHHVVTVNIKKMDALEDMSRSIHIVSRVVRSIALLSDETQAKLEHKKIDEKYNSEKVKDFYDLIHAMYDLDKCKIKVTDLTDEIPYNKSYEFWTSNKCLLVNKLEFPLTF